MRSFLALLPDPDTAMAMDCWRASACATLQRPVPIQNLHITLCFLGDLPPPTLDRLQLLLNSVVLKPFTISLDELGYWPGSGTVYLGAQQPVEELDILARRCRTAANRAGIRMDKRPFQAHVTLARGQNLPPAPPLTAPQLNWPVEAFALQRSTLAPQGVRYDTLRAWP